MTIADVTNVGNVLGVGSSVTGVVTFCALFVIYHMANQYTSMLEVSLMTQFQYAIAGDLIALVLSQLAAAYAAVKAIDAVAKATTGFYRQQRGGSTTGDFMTLYELFAGFSYLTWTLIISVVGYVAAGLLLEEYAKREYGAAKGGLGGAAFGANDGYKYLALGTIIGGGAWVGSVALGDSASELLGFFNNYDTFAEGYNYDATQQDTDGTSILYDLTFHVVSLSAYFVVSTAIWLGGIVFGFVWMNPSSEYKCVELDQAVKEKWVYVLSQTNKQTDYDACLKSVESTLSDPKYASVKGQLSRCENAQFLFAAGNKAEYSKKYARAYTQPELQAHICTQYKKK